MRYRRVIAEAARTPWALLPEKLAAVEKLLSDKARGVVYSDEEIQARISDRRAERIASRHGSVAVLPVVGTILHRASDLEQASGAVSVQALTRHLRGLVSDEQVKVVILDIDSPGGSVSGVEELAREIHAAQQTKPVIAVANSMAASAAYWLAAQASEVVVTPSGSVGSIGVYAMHVDYSGALEKEGIGVSFIQAGEHKTEGHPYAPLDDEARAEMQGRIDDYYGMFAGAVKRGRPNVSGDVMQGRMYTAQQAVKVKLADRVATLDETIARFAGGGTQQRSARALTSAQIAAMKLRTL